MNRERVLELAAQTGRIYLHPAPKVPVGWQLIKRSMTPNQRQLMLRAEEFTADELWIMLLAAAPEYKP